MPTIEYFSVTPDAIYAGQIIHISYKVCMTAGYHMEVWIEFWKDGAKVHSDYRGYQSLLYGPCKEEELDRYLNEKGSWEIKLIAQDFIAEIKVAEAHDSRFVNVSEAPPGQPVPPGQPPVGTPAPPFQFKIDLTTIVIALIILVIIYFIIRKVV